jgi:hypothetical protein
MQIKQLTRAAQLATVTVALGASVALAKVIVDFPLSDASGHVTDVVAGGKPITVSGDLADPKDYAQPGPAAGTYGEITLSAEQAAAIKSAHFGGKTKLDLGPAKDSPLNLTGDFTVTAWVKFEKTDGYHMILATGAGSGNGWKVGINDANPTFTANGVADVAAEDVTIDSDKWMFLAVTVAGTKDARTVTFYVNGKKANADALTAESITPSDVSQMHLGGADNANDTDENFVGNLAQLRVYDTVLDAAAIKAAATTAKP